MATTAAVVPEHGWRRVWEGDFLLKMGDDPRRVRALGAEAAEVGRRLDELDLEMTALALEGLALVLEGALTEGMARLDEATTAAVCGEMTDPFAIGISCCYLVDACERIRDFDRAAQWCARVKEIAERTRFNALRGICRAQYAGVLVWRGEWTEAEAELRGAVRDLGASRPALQVEALERPGCVPLTAATIGGSRRSSRNTIRPISSVRIRTSSRGGSDSRTPVGVDARIATVAHALPAARAEIASADQAKDFLDMGVRHFSVGTDITILHQWWKSQGEDLREALGG